MNLLQPKALVTSLSGIDLEGLWNQGKRGIILDLDNTITPWQQDVLTTEAELLIKSARAKGYRIHLLSNASNARAKRVADTLEIGFTAPGYKPFSQGYKQALQKLGLPGEQVIAIGDQVFTDVWGGNRAGCYTVLVTPLQSKEFIGTKITRLLERLVRRKIL